MQLLDRVAIVTGGASGIGAAIVHRFAQEGARVAIFDLGKDRIAQAAAAIPDARAAAFPCDVSKEADVANAVQQVAERFGRIDILINDAGIKPKLELIEDVAESDWDAMLNVHLRGCYLCTKHVLPHMKARARGAIVNIASLAGIRGRPLRHSYIAAKHGMVGLTRSVALECRPHNIRVNAIAPGPVATLMLAGSDTPGNGSEWAARLAAHKAKGGSEIDFLIRPEAIAAAALFLVSDEAPNICGVILPIDGGTMAGSPRH